ncbi:protein kinase domain-containing protein [Filimonas effusa]|uniref:Protein kinase domain-containing protein n=1 Tax=Filimonas effusa TaxID=2508721 RepID=A0A4Q1D1L4_9BACT|nr:lanthionine synthetase LanC family protein [Filimonas effusa]RXK81745.1 hypothetical protein ESB13_18300 [Filimonas effusa]
MQNKETAAADNSAATIDTPPAQQVPPAPAVAAEATHNTVTPGVETAASTTEPTVTPEQEYAALLRNHGFEFKELQYHWQVGELPETRAWILHLSVIPTQVKRLLDDCLPILKAAGVSFRLAKTQAIVNMLLGGSFGKAYVGKIITIYPKSVSNAIELAARLVAFTTYKGPLVATDIHLGGIVYTRHGGTAPQQLPDSRPPGQRLIANLFTNRIQDTLYDPWYLAPGVEWPFGDIKAHQPPAEGNSEQHKLHNKYTINSTIKADMKGCVYRASYFTGFTQEPCIIKAAHYAVSADEYDRDNTDRLRWQYQLHEALRDVIPLPKILDLFEKDTTVYMAMEFVQGVSLRDWIGHIRKYRHWFHLTAGEKRELINMLIHIVTLIEKMHLAGYLHRDITSQNFIIGRGNKITLIDLELAYDTTAVPLQPPFALGSFGYMSPEQRTSQAPTSAQDVYNIGGLMIRFFAGLSPRQIDQVHPANLEKNLLFFTGSSAIVRLITGCMAQDPTLRPDIRAVKEGLYSLLQEVEQSRLPYISVNIVDERIKVPAGRFEWPTFKRGLVQDFSSNQTSLLHGVTGMAVCVCGVLRNDKLADTPEISAFIQQCFSRIGMEADIATGMAGQGLALLECLPWIDDKAFASKQLNAIVQLLATQQLPDGSWALRRPTDETSRPGLLRGVAGILLFLLEFYHQDAQPGLKEVITDGLNWLVREKRNENGFEGWHNNGRLDLLTFSEGSLGIIYVLIKAGHILEAAEYKALSNRLLSRVPEYILLDSASLEYGMAGLGETYLLAGEVFEDVDWLKRAAWVSAVIQHTSISQKQPYHMFWRQLQHPTLALCRPEEYELAYLEKQIQVYQQHQTIA